MNRKSDHSSRFSQKSRGEVPLHKMEHVDHASVRVSLGTLVGFVSGATLAVWKGYPLRATALKVAGSCALVITSLSVTERIAYASLESHMNSDFQSLMVSHAFSGIAGGGLNGYLYQKRPVRGVVFFLPIMLGVGFLEFEWKKEVQRRIQELAKEGQQDVPPAKHLSSAQGDNVPSEP